MEPPATGEGLLESVPVSVDIESNGSVMNIPLEPGRLLSGRVLDRNGVASSYALVQIAHPDTGLVVGTGLTDENGTFRVTIPFTDLPEVSFSF